MQKLTILSQLYMYAQFSEFRNINQFPTSTSMKKERCRLLPKMAMIFVFFLNLMLAVAQADKASLETYIVQVKQPEGKSSALAEELESFYKSFLPTSIDSTNQQQRMVYSYHNVMTGFAARLTKEEAKEMEKKEGFVSARPERAFYLHTTHTPAFIGLNQNFGLWPNSSFGKGVIIGLMDTGILPTHVSFSDKDMPPPPAKWKGKCDFNRTECNNKLIGARAFLSISNQTGTPPEDFQGHGTHTASTAAGNFVEGANSLGFANGTAAGMAPLAHLAMYKVCDAFCLDSDILAGFDAAIEDGVDILSLSLGGGSLPFYLDSIAIGAFAAIQNNIFVSCSAGNSGPESSTLSNEAPWILTVGASTVDRSIMATARLGNGAEFDGQSMLQPKEFNPIFLPLVYAGMNGNSSSAECEIGSLDDVDVKGKIVLCEGGYWFGGITKGRVVKDAGGAAMILMNREDRGYITSPSLHVLPATAISYSAGLKIKEYINSTSSPTATIVFKGTVVGIKTAPMVSDFSSRGPSNASPGILKPDIIGPGVTVLAAYPFPDENTTDPTMSFAFLSGTSMSCPHLSGIAALLKSSHPDWSPAAIKSAIITSADTLNLRATPIMDHLLHPANIFTTGAGHVNPSRANNPGLVYDVQPQDYIPYLCGLGYKDDQIGVIVLQNVTCEKLSGIPEAQLNYPSFSLKLWDSNQTYTRTVTNVGEPNSSYTVQVIAPEYVDVSVSPTRLDFTEVNQKLTYSVTFSPHANRNGSNHISQGALKWISGMHVVTSPIAVVFY